MLTGGEIVSTFGNPEKVKLGKCKLIEEVMIGEDKVCVVWINKLQCHYMCSVSYELSAYIHSIY